MGQEFPASGSYPLTGRSHQPFSGVSGRLHCLFESNIMRPRRKVKIEGIVKCEEEKWKVKKINYPVPSCGVSRISYINLNRTMIEIDVCQRPRKTQTAIVVS
jgi:hypothetical protein